LTLVVHSTAATPQRRQRADAQAASVRSTSRDDIPLILFCLRGCSFAVLPTTTKAAHHSRRHRQRRRQQLQRPRTPQLPRCDNHRCVPRHHRRRYVKDHQCLPSSNRMRLPHALSMNVHDCEIVIHDGWGITDVSVHTQPGSPSSTLPRFTIPALDHRRRLAGLFLFVSFVVGSCLLAIRFDLV
jgi:hypothetical protein